MFFGLFGDKLSGAIAKQVGSLLNKQAKKFLSNLKDLQSTTLNDACDVIADSANFQKAGIPVKLTTDRISMRGDSKQVVDLSTTPLDSLSTSPVFAAALVTKLKSNVPLKVAAREAGVDLDDLLLKYCPAYIKYAMPQIVHRLLDEHTGLYAGYVVIALAKGEPYELGKIPQRRDMVKFFSALGSDRSAAIERASNLWKKRSSSGYEYKRNIYGK